MKVKSNKIKDIRDHYFDRLKNNFPPEEASKLLEILFESLLNMPRIKILTDPNLRITESELLKIHFAAKSLMEYKPVQHITGKAHFYGLELSVNKHVLIPRPETEELVEWMLEKEMQITKLNVLDIGTGSGAIALALKNERSAWNIFAIDSSKQALETAQKNAKSNGLEIRFQHDDITKPSIPVKIPKFDLIVSNPPYVTESDKKLMQPNVLSYEPAEALYVPDDDPLLFYSAILLFAVKKLKKGGSIYFEINEKFGNEMQELLTKFNYSQVEIRKDLNGKNRMIRGIKESQ